MPPIRRVLNRVAALLVSEPMVPARLLREPASPPPLPRLVGVEFGCPPELRGGSPPGVTDLAVTLTAPCPVDMEVARAWVTDGKVARIAFGPRPVYEGLAVPTWMIEGIPVGGARVEAGEEVTIDVQIKRSCADALRQGRFAVFFEGVVRGADPVWFEVDATTVAGRPTCG